METNQGQLWGSMRDLCCPVVSVSEGALEGVLEPVRLWLAWASVILSWVTEVGKGTF